MAKIKLTEEQIVMLQGVEDNLFEGKKVLQITKEQLDMISESINEDASPELTIFQDTRGFYLGTKLLNPVTGKSYPHSRNSGYYQNSGDVCKAFSTGHYDKDIDETLNLNEFEQPKDLGSPVEACKLHGEQEVKELPPSLKPSNRITKNFKKGGKDIQSDKEIKYEGENLMGHPIGGKGGDEYNPQSEKENEKTFKSFNEGTGEIKIPKPITNRIAKLKDLISKAFDSDGDPIGIVDRMSTWEEPSIYSVNLQNGVINISDKPTYGGNPSSLDYDLKRYFKNKDENWWIYDDAIDHLNYLIRNYKRTLKSNGITTEVAKPVVSEGLTVEILEFAQHIVEALKGILTDPSQAGLSPFWKQLGVSRGELFSAMADIGLITSTVMGGNRVYKVMRKNFKRNIKRLYNTLTQPEELDSWEGPKNVMKNPKMEASNLPAGSEHDSSAPWNDRDMSQPVVPTEVKYTVTYMNNEISIVEDSEGKKYAFYHYHIDRDDLAPYAEREETYVGRDEDGDVDVDYSDDWDVDEQVIQGYLNDNLHDLEIGSGLMDWESGADLALIDDGLKANIIDTFGGDERLIAAMEEVRETTTAGSSGAFVGKMGMGSPIGKATAYSPKNQIQDKTASLGDDLEIIQDEEAKLGNVQFDTPYGRYSVVGATEKDDNKPHATTIFVTLQKNGRPVSSHLLYYFNDKGDEKLTFVYKYEKLENVFNITDPVYHEGLRGLMAQLKGQEVEETTVAGASVDGGSSGPYVTPKMWAKDDKNWAMNKDDKTAWKGGKIVDKKSKANMTMESDNMTKTAYPDGEMVDFDDCVKYNNNDAAQKGGCSQGAVDGVVKTSKTKGSVISDEALYYEIAEQTGRSVDDVKKIIEENEEDKDWYKVSNLIKDTKKKLGDIPKKSDVEALFNKLQADGYDKLLLAKAWAWFTNILHNPQGEERIVDEAMSVGQDGKLVDDAEGEKPEYITYKGDPEAEKAWIVAKYKSGKTDKVEVPDEYSRHVIDLMGPEGEQDWSMRKWYEYLKFYK